ncbi:MAG: hypothetical protein NZ580_06130 [Bacteroidia bacterium]|nr:hypothetical protein [Bacteroidia bacterium]MDW8236388.1 hypothetical protein [Bacteroidia bacterium]
MPAWRNWLKSLFKDFQEEEPSHTPPSPSSELPSDTSVPLSTLKEWVTQRISPFAWDRAIIRLLSTQQNLKLPLAEMLKPSPSTQVPSYLLIELSRIIQEMYGIQIPQNLITAKV